MSNIARVTAAIVMIAMFSCAALFRSELAGMQKELRSATEDRRLLGEQLASAHSRIGILHQRVAELQQHNKPQTRPSIPESGRQANQPHARASGPESKRRLAAAATFDVADYARQLKSLPHPAGVDLNNNNSFVLFGQPADYALSRTQDNLMLAGRQFFVRGEFKASGQMMLPYYTPAVLQALQSSCDAKDPAADPVGCSLLSYSKVIALEAALKTATDDLKQYKMNQAVALARTAASATNDSMAYTDLREAALKKYAEQAAAVEADAAQLAAKHYADRVQNEVKEFVNQTAAKTAFEAQKATEKNSERYANLTAWADIFETESKQYADQAAATKADNAQAAARAYTQQIKQELETFMNDTAVRNANIAQASLASAKAFAEALSQAKNYTDQSNADAKTYAGTIAASEAQTVYLSSRKYTDETRQALETFANTAATNKSTEARLEENNVYILWAIRGAISQAKNYTDTTKAELEVYADTVAGKEAGEAKVAATSYTDAAKQALKTFASAAATTKANEAKAAAQTAIAAAILQANNYTDVSKTATEKYAVTAATQKAAAAQGVAKAYTDALDAKVNIVNASLGTAKADLSAKVQQAENRSSEYTDSREIVTKRHSLNTAFPVGSLYITFDQQDPNSLFADTKWQRVAGGRTLVGVIDAGDSTNYGSYAFDKAGVSKPDVWRATSNHTLTLQEMPSHRHEQMWRWACDTVVRTNNAVEKCATHSLHQDISYIDYASDQKLNGLIGMSDALTWRTTRSKVWREHHEVGSDFLAAAAGHDHSFDIDIIQPYTTVHMWRRTE